MDRADVLAGLGVLAMIVGMLWLHPATLLIGAGYVAITNARSS